MLNNTKTVAIMCIVIVVLLGILIYANRESLFSGKKEDETPKTGEDKEKETEE